MSNQIPVILYIDGVPNYTTYATYLNNKYIYDIKGLTSNTNYSICLNYVLNNQYSPTSEILNANTTSTPTSTPIPSTKIN